MVTQSKMKTKIRFSAIDIAKALASAGVHEPNPQQQVIIESTDFSPTLVVAGAGSGKTETMSARVLWLIANQFAKPSEILGLTFTNKAASELQQRIRKRVRQLKKSNLLSPLEWQEIGTTPAQVFTYHAYAGKILREDGIKLGIDVTGEPMGEAASWQLARKILINTEAFSNLAQKSLDSLIDEMIDLSDAMAEHNVSQSMLHSHAQSVLEKIDLVTPGRGGKISSKIPELGQITLARIELLSVVDKFNEARMQAGTLTFNDQMNLTAKLLTANEDLARPIRVRERSKYKFVILDEFQDTSPVQIEYLAAIFGNDHAVTAVGDPNQAIYEWRGAGAETLIEFGNKFASNKNKVNHFELTTSWRNDKTILDLANVTIENIKLKRETMGLNSDNQKLKVSKLEPSKKAQVGHISLGRYLTAADEANAIAAEYKRLWIETKNDVEANPNKKSFAVLVRTKSLISDIQSSLIEAGLPVEVVGFDGLIHLPEIADLIAMLKILLLPDSGTAFMRIATGPLLNLGASDIYGLSNFLNHQRKTQRPTLSKAITQNLANDNLGEFAKEEFFSGSVIEAIDSLTNADAKYFTKAGLERLLKFKSDLKRLRRSLYGSITDSIMAVVHYLNLDTELELRDGGGRGVRHLNKFLDEAMRFARTGGNLFDFLSWIDVADSEERGLKPAEIEVDSSVVQILTIHSAKGLEWDVVCVPGLVEKKFPSVGGRVPQWTKHIGVIPSEFRRDSAIFDHFVWPLDLNSPEIVKALETFDSYWKERKLLEEYRLCYVAFTRAKSNLLLTSALFYGENKTQSTESIFAAFAREIIAQNKTHKIIFECEEVSENPFSKNPAQAIWPTQPTVIQERIAQAALVTEAKPFSLAELETESKNNKCAPLAELFTDSLALLKQYESKSDVVNVHLPQRLSVSALISLEADREEFALNIRRPMPVKIDTYSKRGTEFHNWLENRFAANKLIEDDELSLDQRQDDVQIALSKLQQTWLASEFANRTPFAVEMPFDLSVAGVVLRGRIDAIYKDGDNYEIVDWKTGKSKTGVAATLASIQLAMYRIAFSRLHQVPLENIKACFYYLADNKIIRPDNLMAEAQLITTLKGAAN